jgi:hypothetical protein
VPPNFLVVVNYPYYTVHSISFVQTISHNGTTDSLRLTFPTVIAPRYGTPPGESGPKGGTNGPGSESCLDFSLVLEMAGQITSIASPSEHDIQWNVGYSSPVPPDAWDASRARISLTQSVFLDRDVVLVLGCMGLDKPRCLAETYTPDEGAQEWTDAYALTFVPRFNLPVLLRQG